MLWFDNSLMDTYQAPAVQGNIPGLREAAVRKALAGDTHRAEVAVVDIPPAAVDTASIPQAEAAEGLGTPAAAGDIPDKLVRPFFRYRETRIRPQTGSRTCDTSLRLRHQIAISQRRKGER